MGITVTPTTTADRREREIFTVTLDLVAKQGYDRLTMDAVAAAASAGKATLYRRWSSKAELVVAAVQALVLPATFPVQDTGSLRADLLSGVCPEMGLDDPRQMAVASGLMTALHTDRELHRAVVEGLLGPRLAELQAVFQRAVDRGELDAGTDVALLATVVPATIFFQTILSPGACTDPDFLTRVVDAVVTPLLRPTPEGT